MYIKTTTKKTLKVKGNWREEKKAMEAIGKKIWVNMSKVLNRMSELSRTLSDILCDNPVKF